MQRPGYSAHASCKQKRTHLADDRLSALPDVLLHTILSFPKAWQVVQTCVLSTRWRHLWCSVPCLDLELEEFVDGDNGKSLEQREEQAWYNFEDFTDNLLYHKNIDIALLDMFRLCCRSRYYVRDSSDRWIRRGIKHSPSWRLKTLHLSGVALVHHFARHISSGCPFLEDLELKDCSGRLGEITSLSQKKLVIVGYCDLFCIPWTITTPALASMRPCTCQVLGYRFLEFPSFNNLRTLCLRNCDLSDDFRTLALFLENSPNLERLTLKHCKFSKDSDRGKASSLDVQCENLRLTEIIYEDDDVRLLVEFLFDISANLPNNTMKITKIEENPQDH